MYLDEALAVAGIEQVSAPIGELRQAGEPMYYEGDIAELLLAWAPGLELTAHSPAPPPASRRKPFPNPSQATTAPRFCRESLSPQQTHTYTNKQAFYSGPTVHAIQKFC